jgi:hypothetical protein
MAVTIQVRRDLAANWTSVNPVLNQGEIGAETDTGKAKLGDGVTAWNSLGYWNAGGDVTSVFGRDGAITAQSGDYSVEEVTGAAPVTSPAFTGSPTAPTQTSSDDSTKLATTAFVQTAAATAQSEAEAASLPLPSGTPAAGEVPVALGVGSASEWGSAGGDVSSVFGRTGAITAESGDYAVSEVTGAAPLASPALTGSPTAPTKSALTNNTDIATTAYADAAVAVETSRAETAEALKAPLASPALTGAPTAPTATALTDSTQLATTAYADSAVAVETSRAETAEALALQKSSNLSDLASASTALTNLGFGTGAVPGATPAFPLVLAPCKWAFINYDVEPYELGGSYTYSNGTAGVGATITAGSNGVLAIDGGSPSVGDRVLVSDGYAHGTGDSPYVDGTYTVTSVGSASTPWVLTRATDTDTAETLFQYWAVQITNGTSFGGGWAQVTTFSGTQGVQTFTVGSTFLQLAIACVSGFAWGTRCVANGIQATAIGTEATAAGNNAVALGNTSLATGTASIAVGCTSKATGEYSGAFGPYSYAPNYGSQAFGTEAVAYACNQMAFASGGNQTTPNQRTLLCLYGTTTSATPVNLTSSDSLTFKLLDYQGNASYKKTMLLNVNIVARRTDTYGTDSAWTMQGVLRGSGAPSNTSVASGSNGGEISQIASWSSPSAGVLDVASTSGYPSAGTLNVIASGSTTAVVTYTGISGNSFTGCAYVSGSPTGTVSTGGAVSLQDAYAWVGGSAPTATLIAQDSAASSWGGVSVSVSTNTVTFTATGASGQTINWLVTVQADELTA